MNNVKRAIIALSLFYGLSVVMAPVQAADLSKTWAGIAIDGYDATSYFIAGEARTGDKRYEFQWQGATWRFATEQGRDKFAANPDRYRPEYGGFCANGMSEGHKIEGSGTIWRIIDDKLYLFYADRGRQRWASNASQWIKDADLNWQRLKNE